MQAQARHICHDDLTKVTQLLSDLYAIRR